MHPSSPLIATTPLTLRLTDSFAEEHQIGTVVHSGLQVSPPVTFVARWASTDSIEISWQDSLRSGVRYELRVAPSLGGPAVARFWTELLRLVDARVLGDELVVDFNLAVDPNALADRLRVVQAGESLSWRSKQNSPSRRIRIALQQSPTEELELRLDASLVPAGGGTPLNKTVQRPVRVLQEVTLLDVQPILRSGQRLISLCFDADVSPSDLKAHLTAPPIESLRERDGRIELLGSFSDPITVTISAGLKSKDGRLLETEVEETVAAPAWPALGFAQAPPTLDAQGRLVVRSTGLQRLQVSASRIPASSLPALLAGASHNSLAVDHRSWDVIPNPRGLSRVSLPPAASASLWFIELTSAQAPWLKYEAKIMQGGLTLGLHHHPAGWTALVEDRQGRPVGQAEVSWIRRSGEITGSQTNTSGRSDLRDRFPLHDPIVWVAANAGPRFVHLPLQASVVEEVSDRTVDSPALLLLDRSGLAPSEQLQGVLFFEEAAKISVRAGVDDTVLATAFPGVPFSAQLPSDLPSGRTFVEARVGSRLIAQVPVSVAPAGPVPFRLSIKAQQDGAFLVTLVPGDFHSTPESVQLSTKCSFEALSTRWHGHLPPALDLGEQTLSSDAPLSVSCPLPFAGTQVRLHARAPEAGGATMVSSAASEFGAPQAQLEPSADGLRLRTESELKGAELRFTFADGESELQTLNAAAPLITVPTHAGSNWVRVEVVDSVRGLLASRTVVSSTTSGKLLSWLSETSAAPGGRWQTLTRSETGLEFDRGRVEAAKTEAASMVGHRVGRSRLWYRSGQEQDLAEDQLQLTPPADLSASVLNFNYATPAGRRTRVWVFAVDPERQAEPVDPRVPLQWAVYDSDALGQTQRGPETVSDAQSLGAGRSSQWPSSQSSVVKGPLRPSGAGYGQFVLLRSQLPHRCRVDVVAEIDGRYEVHSQSLPDQGASESWPPWLREGDQLKLGREQSAPPGMSVQRGHAVMDAIADAPGGPKLVARPQLAFGGSTQFASHRQSGHFEANSAGVLRVGPKIVDGYRAALARAKTRPESLVADAARLLVETAFGDVDQELRARVLDAATGSPNTPRWQVIVSAWALQSTGDLPEGIRVQLKSLVREPSPSLCASARFLLAVDGQRSSPCVSVSATSIAESAAADILRGDRPAGFTALEEIEAPTSPAEQGLALLALLKVAPRHEFVNILRDQLVASAKQGSWETPEADAFATLALSRVPSSTKPYWGSILSRGSVLKRFSNQRTTEIELSAEQLSQGVDVTVTGAGRVHLGLATVAKPQPRQDRLRIERTIAKPGPVRRGDIIDVSIKLERPAGSGGKSLIRVEEYLPAGLSTVRARSASTLNFEAKLAPGEHREFRYKARALWSGRFEWPGVWAEAPWERPVLAARAEDAHLTVD